MALPTNSVYAQKRTGFRASRRGHAQQTNEQRLQKALSQALDRIDKLEADNKASKDLITAALEERDAARIERDKAKESREAMERENKIAREALTASQEVIKEAKSVMGEQREFIKEQRETMKIVQEQNIKLYGELSKANSRTVKVGLGGFAIGVLTSIIKIF